MRPLLAVLWALGVAGQTLAAYVLSSARHLPWHEVVFGAAVLVTAAAAVVLVLLPASRWGEARSAVEFTGCVSLVVLAATVVLLGVGLMLLPPWVPSDVTAAVALASTVVPAGVALVALRLARRTERRPPHVRAAWVGGLTLVGGGIVVLMTSLQ